MSNNIEYIERQELINKLISNGYGDIVQALLEDEKKVYTKKGRLNKSGACRRLKLKAKQLEDKLAEMRELLKKDLE
jgi:predicted metal-dependent hydrolase